MDERTWCIKNVVTGEYWSNDFGWIDEHFSLFSEEEKSVYNLPIEGEWELFHVEEEGK